MVRSSVVVIAFLFVAPVLADDAEKITKERLRRYVETSESQRSAFVIEAERQVRQQQDNLQRAKQRRDSVDIKEFQESLSVANKNLAFYKSTELGRLPPILEASLEVGKVGFVLRVKVDQVASETEMLATIKTPNDIIKSTPVEVQVFISGASTKGMTDGSIVTLDSPLCVTGTKSYETVTGARRTIFRLEPIDRDDIATHLAGLARRSQADEDELKREVEATLKLDAIKILLKSKPVAAKQQLKDLTKKYVGAKAAIEAQLLLDEM